MRCIREWFCRWFGPRAVDGWDDLVAAVVRAEGLYVDHVEHVVGAPLAWSLLRRDDAGRLVPIDAFCAVSGVRVSGASKVDATDPDHPKADIAHFGVRCARCGRPLHVRHANMPTLVDVPMCVACRPEVLRVIRLIKEHQHG